MHLSIHNSENHLEESSINFLEKRKSISEPHKILFTGLDGAGKSSIILALQREFSRISITKPTKGAQRRIFTLMGREISEWDLGGQKSYRISYLKNPSRYFDDTEVAIYVIDILDVSRIPESLSYLIDVTNKFKELKIEPPINVFFHKCDPLILQRIENEIENQINAVKKEIEETLNYKEIHYFKTSVYNLYSIMSAISTILLELFPKSQLIQKTIEEFARKLNCTGLLIIDANSIILGSFFKDDDSEELLNKTVSYFSTLNDTFLEMELGLQEDQIIVKKSKKYYLFKPIILNDESIPYYMLILKEHNPFDLYFINKDLPVFINILKDILMK